MKATCGEHQSISRVAPDLDASCPDVPHKLVSRRERIAI